MNNKNNSDKNSSRIEIEQMVRDFYKTRRIVNIDNDDLEPFFGDVGTLMAFDHQEPTSCTQGMELICDAIKQELHSLEHDYHIERVLFLLFQSAQHELQITELEGFSKIGLPSGVSVTWGLGTQESEYTRVVTLVLIQNNLISYE